MMGRTQKSGATPRTLQALGKEHVGLHGDYMPIVEQTMTTNLKTGTGTETDS
jgi:hypothetical protein